MSEISSVDLLDCVMSDRCNKSAVKVMYGSQREDRQTDWWRTRCAGGRNACGGLRCWTHHHIHCSLLQQLTEQWFTPSVISHLREFHTELLWRPQLKRLECVWNGNCHKRFVWNTPSMCCMLNKQWTEKANNTYPCRLRKLENCLCYKLVANQKSNTPPKGSVSRKQVEPNTGKCVVLLC